MTVTIYLMNAEGSNPRNLTNSSAEEGQLAWSPDGKRDCLGCVVSDSEHDIFIVNANGSGLTNLVTQSAVNLIKII